MYQLNKKAGKLIITLCLLLTFQVIASVFDIQNIQAETNVEQPQLCKEETGFILPYGEGRVRLYDCYGNFCSIVSEYDSFFYIPTIHLDRVMIREERDYSLAYRVKDGRVLYKADTENQEIQALKNSFFVFDKQTGKTDFYDNEGTLLYSYIENFPAGMEMKHYVEDTSNASFIEIVPANSEEVFTSSYYLYVSDDHQVFKLLDKEIFGNEIYELKSFGKNILVTDNTVTPLRTRLLNTDGQCMYDNVESYGSDLAGDFFKEYYCPQVNWICINNGQIFEKLNPDLEVIDEISFPDNSTPELSGDYYIGASYKSMDYQVCDGVILYNNKSAPYTKTEEGIQVYTSDGSVFIPVPEHFIVEKANEYLVLLYSDLQGWNNYYMLMNYRTGEYLFNNPSYVSENKDAQIHLRKNYCVIQDFSDRSYSILNSQGELCYQEKSVYCSEFSDEYIYMNRGPYYGFVDIYGNWVFKTYQNFGD